MSTIEQFSESETAEMKPAIWFAEELGITVDRVRPLFAAGLVPRAVKLRVGWRAPADAATCNRIIDLVERAAELGGRVALLQDPEVGEYRCCGQCGSERIERIAVERWQCRDCGQSVKEGFSPSAQQLGDLIAKIRTELGLPLPACDRCSRRLPLERWFAIQLCEDCVADFKLGLFTWEEIQKLRGEG